MRYASARSDLADEKKIKQHPAIVHLHIHILEMSDEPERARASADALATMCPDAGHMNHMPGHVHVLCGEYQRARAASERAIAANDLYLAYAGPLTPYTTACAHDLLLMMHACMFMGRFRDSMEAANKLGSMLTKDVLSVKDRPKFSTSLEGYYSMRTHVMVRFGRWQEIVDEPLPDDAELYLVSTAMLHYAKGVAHASLKNFRRRRQERRLFHDSVGASRRIARFSTIPPAAYWLLARRCWTASSNITKATLRRLMPACARASIGTTI